MNFKLITTLYTLSACTIAPTLTQSSVQAATVENPLQPEASTVAIMTQPENDLIRTMAQPETFSTPPEILTAEPSTEVSLAETPLAETPLTEVPSPVAQAQVSNDRYRPKPRALK